MAQGQKLVQKQVVELWKQLMAQLVTGWLQQSNRRFTRTIHINLRLKITEMPHVKLSNTTIIQTPMSPFMNIQEGINIINIRG